MRTAAEQEGGAEGRPGQLWASFPPGAQAGHLGSASSGLPASEALQVLRDQVGLVMFGEVVTPHEALLTLGTLEAFVPWGEEMPITHRARSQTLSQPPKSSSTCDVKLVASKIIVIGHK